MFQAFRLVWLPSIVLASCSVYERTGRETGNRRAGWGYFDPGPGAGGGLSAGNYVDGYQNVPIDWSINTPRKRAFFDLLRQVTGA